MERRFEIVWQLDVYETTEQREGIAVTGGKIEGLTFAKLKRAEAIMSRFVAEIEALRLETE